MYICRVALAAMATREMPRSGLPAVVSLVTLEAAMVCLNLNNESVAIDKRCALSRVILYLGTR